jgi:hypothetical protein
VEQRTGKELVKRTQNFRRSLEPASKTFNINLKDKQHYWTLGFSLSVLPFLVRAEQVYRALPQLHAQSYKNKLPSLSIIVPARNEAQNLRRLLPSLEKQDYPGQIEIIIVDDHSTDDTLEVIECRQRDLNSSKCQLHYEVDSCAVIAGRMVGKTKCQPCRSLCSKWGMVVIYGC